MAHAKGNVKFPLEIKQIQYNSPLSSLRFIKVTTADFHFCVYWTEEQSRKDYSGYL